MKDQYFGDINDFKKYGLLRSIIRATDFRVLVAWMLTPDDGGTDGKFTAYLHQPQEYAHHDPVLFEGLNRMLEALRSATPGSSVEAFSTVNVVFLMALQPDHHDRHDAIVDSVQAQWEGRIAQGCKLVI